MARIQFTALVESIRGSIGGTTFQRNAFGYTAKRKPATVNPNSSYQYTYRAAFQKALQTWLSLTDVQRGNWNTYAATYPTASKNNPDAYLTGFNLFVRWHSLQFSVSTTVLTNPSGTQGSVLVDELPISTGGSDLTLDMVQTLTGGNWTVFIYLSRVLKPTQKFVKSTTRFMNHIVNVTGNISPNLATPYTNRFGALPVPDDYLGIDVTFLKQDNAQVVYLPSQVLQMNN